MTSYAFTHLLAKRNAPGRFVIQSPGPAFDLIYSAERARGQLHAVWRLELKSKPPDVALRALLTECARAALGADVWLAAQPGRVADMLAEPAFAELADFDSSTASHEEVEPLTSTPELRAALDPIVRHMAELERRGHVAERFQVIATDNAHLNLTPGAGNVFRYQPSGSVASQFCKVVELELSGDLGVLQALAAGELHSTPAKASVTAPTPGRICFLLASQLRQARSDGGLVLVQDLDPSEQTRALRQLAALLGETIAEAATAIRSGADAAVSLARANQLLLDHHAVESAKPDLLSGIATRGAGVSWMTIAERANSQLPRQTIDVPEQLRRFCALYEWPPGNCVDWRGIHKTQVYQSPTWKLCWRVSPGRAGHYVFTADLERMRRIAEGSLTSIEVFTSPVRPQC